MAAIVQLSPEEDDATTTWNEASGHTTGGAEPDELDLDELSVEEVIQRLGVTREQIDKAIKKEVANLESFKVFSRMGEQDLPDGVRILGSTMVMAVPPKGLQTRICAQDFNNAVRDDVFSPTPSLSGLRILLALATASELTMRFGDFTAAFLHAYLDQDDLVAVNETSKDPRSTRR